MVFKQGRGVYDGDGDHGSAALFRDLKAAVVEGKEGVIDFVPCAFREDEDRDAAFCLVDGREDRLDAFLYVFAVQEQAVHVGHPTAEQEPFEHFLFGDIARGPWNAHIGQKDVEVASVIGNIYYRTVLWNIRLADNDHLCAGCPKAKAKAVPYQEQAQASLGVFVDQSDDPFHEKYGNENDQERHDVEYDDDKS